MAISKITTSGIAGDTLTAADIADDAIGTAELANDVVISTSGNITTTGKLSTPSMVQTDAQNLSGTYSTHELIMGKTFTATGDLTVNTNLVLVNMSGSGDDVTIQDDGTATTITGTGTLEAGEMLAKERSVVTGMTGVLGSAVTGGTGLTSIGTTTDGSNLTSLGTVASGTLGSGVTFPAGHVIQTVSDTYATETNTGSGTTWKNTELAVTITPTASSSKIMLQFSVPVYHNAGAYTVGMGIFRGDNNGTNLGNANYGMSSSQAPTAATIHMHTAVFVDSPSTTSATLYTLCIRESADNQTYYCVSATQGSLVAQEIAQ